MLFFLLLILQLLLVVLNLVGLPGNIVSLIFPLIYFFSSKINFWQLLFLICLIAAGEVIEFLLGYYTGKKVGAVKGSFFVSVIFSIVLGIVMAPLFFGVGAIIGTFLGAFIGTFLYEYLVTRDKNLAFERGVASFKGRFMGTFLKVSIGISTVILSGFYIF
ncbi:DUF456 domain-containing protein [Deferribacterales bacterium Es71-Z0220]|uniref:DUF456 family protein n=1 Tax=Deferrivibrio essentukiensis TaxID=2880922 RepID=UPI001F61B347|nr:DUF456 domain-containing protein [Deferrivibrio essentukiensis]